MGSQPCKPTAESSSLEGEVEPGVVRVLCAQEGQGDKGIHNRKAPWRRGRFLTRSDVIAEKELNYKADSPGGGKEEGRVGTWRDSSLVMGFVLAEDAGWIAEMVAHNCP